ncbi:MAG: exodeoxyribonuclease III [Pseudomonadota bacterium]
MKIATWNINGVKARIDNVLAWLKEAEPDIACLQEIKSVTEAFPTAAFEDLGYNLAVHGQKGFNGVAILSKLPLDEVIERLPGDDADEQARFVECVVSTKSGALRVCCLYLPNGNPPNTEKYPYKLGWMDRLQARAESLLAAEETFVLAGDYNVIPEPADCYAPDAWIDDALFKPETRAAYRRLVNLGLTDAVRACSMHAPLYTFWDYQAGAWQKNNGIRIDHLLLSPRAADRLRGAAVDRHVRAWEKPSDHVPVWIDLAA